MPKVSLSLMSYRLATALWSCLCLFVLSALKWFFTGNLLVIYWSYFCSLYTNFIWSGRWVLSYHSMKFSDFPDHFYFPKVLSFKSLSNLWDNSYIPCLLLIIALSFTCGEKKVWQNIKRCQNIMKMIVCKISLSFHVFINSSSC